MSCQALPLPPSPPHGTFVVEVGVCVAGVGVFLGLLSLAPFLPSLADIEACVCPCPHITILPHPLDPPVLTGLVQLRPSPACCLLSSLPGKAIGLGRPKLPCPKRPNMPAATAQMGNKKQKHTAPAPVSVYMNLTTEAGNGRRRLGEGAWMLPLGWALFKF